MILGLLFDASMMALTCVSLTLNTGAVLTFTVVTSTGHAMSEIDAFRATLSCKSD
jgi:hypothetical protein